MGAFCLRLEWKGFVKLRWIQLVGVVESKLPRFSSLNFFGVPKLQTVFNRSNCVFWKKPAWWRTDKPTTERGQGKKLLKSGRLQILSDLVFSWRAHNHDSTDRQNDKQYKSLLLLGEESHILLGEKPHLLDEEATFARWGGQTTFYKYTPVCRWVYVMFVLYPFSAIIKINLTYQCHHHRH